MANPKFTEAKINELKKQFKSKGQIMGHSLQYLNDKHFFVNKQFNNKDFSIHSISENRMSEGLLGLFKTKKAAIEFGVQIGLKQIDAPVIENTTYQDRVKDLEQSIDRKIKDLITQKGKDSKFKVEQVLRVKDKQQFNLSGGRYLVEISDVELIDSDGHTYSHDVLTLEQLSRIVDSFL